MNITLERLTHADINLLRELRNANADAFFDATYITREAQEDWWYCYTMSTALQFYTIWMNKVTPVGFLSVKALSVGLPPEARGTTHPFVWTREIGHLLLAPAHRGRGIMTAAITEVRRLYDPLTFWVAHVKSTNIASLKLFAAQGFIQCDRITKRRQRKSVISDESTPQDLQKAMISRSPFTKLIANRDKR
jgi:RimJ/RimL family protein N-acetyltransferase